MSNEQVKKVYVLTWGYNFFKSDGKDIILPEDIFVFDTESMAIEAIREQVSNKINIVINNFLGIAKNYPLGVQTIVAKTLKEIKKKSIEPETCHDFNKFIWHAVLRLDDMLDKAFQVASLEKNYNGTVFAELVSCFDIIRKAFYNEEDYSHHYGHYEVTEKIVDAFEIKDEQQVDLNHLNSLTGN